MNYNIQQNDFENEIGGGSNTNNINTDEIIVTNGNDVNNMFEMEFYNRINQK